MPLCPYRNLVSSKARDFRARKIGATLTQPHPLVKFSPALFSLLPRYKTTLFVLALNSNSILSNYVNFFVSVVLMDREKKKSLPVRLKGVTVTDNFFTVLKGDANFFATGFQALFGQGGRAGTTEEENSLQLGAVHIELFVGDADFEHPVIRIELEQTAFQGFTREESYDDPVGKGLRFFL